MTRRSGLTLIEVLAATVIVSLLVVHCVRVLRTSLRVLHSGPSPMSVDDLGELADQLLAGPEGAEARGMAPGDGMKVEWTGGATGPRISIRRISAESGFAAHAWLIVRCGEVEVARCLVEDAPEPRTGPWSAGRVP